MRVLIDMNLSPNWVPYLRSAGIDAMHWTDIGSGDAPDSEVMLWAQQNSCVLLTADLDFSAILAATGRNGPSVVQIRSDLLNADAIGPNVLHVVTNLNRELEAGAIVTLDRHRMRIRILPLGA